MKELRALTQEHDYPVWSAQVLFYEGQLQLTRGEARAAVTLMRQGLDAYRATGATLAGVHFAILLAEALTQDGRWEDALMLLKDHIVAVNDTGALWCAAELHRRRGQLLLEGTVPDFVGAEAEFLRAMDIARGQSAKLWELRAAVSLARLWRDQDRKSDAHHVLGPIHAWFTEGFDCADLKAAKLLLAELSHSAHRGLSPSRRTAGGDECLRFAIHRAGPSTYTRPVNMWRGLTIDQDRCCPSPTCDAARQLRLLRGQIRASDGGRADVSRTSES